MKKPLIQSEPSSAKMLRTSSSDSALARPPPPPPPSSLDKPDERKREEGTNGGKRRNGDNERLGKETRRDGEKEARIKGGRPEQKEVMWERERERELKREHSKWRQQPVLRFLPFPPPHLH